MKHELPERFMPELKEAIAEAIRSSPKVHALIAEASRSGAELNLALVVGVLAGKPSTEVVQRLQRLLADADLTMGTVEELEHLADEPQPPPTLGLSTPRRQKLRLEITPEDQKFFRRLGLDY